MQFVQFQVARVDNGAVLPRAKVTVYLTGTTVKAALFDQHGSSIGNPVTADVTGQVGFAAANGIYDFQSASADGQFTNPPIIAQQLFDLASLAIVGGLYTPTLTAVGNCTGLSLVKATYQQIGTRVDGSAVFDLTLTASGTLTKVGVSLPVTSDIGQTADIIGSCRVLSSTNFAFGYVNGDSANDRALLTITPTSASGSTVRVSADFSYAVAADVTAPTLTSPTASAITSSGATLGVTTTEGTGTLYCWVGLSSSTPTAAVLKAGTGAAVSVAQGVTASGAQSIPISAGLAPSKTYYAYFLQRDLAGNESAIVSCAFNTAASASLGTLALSGISSPFIIGTPASGPITGATAGSSIAGSSLPPGFTIDSTGRTWTYDGSVF